MKISEEKAKVLQNRFNLHTDNATFHIGRIPKVDIESMMADMPTLGGKQYPAFDNTRLKFPKLGMEHFPFPRFVTDKNKDDLLIFTIDSAVKPLTNGEKTMEKREDEKIVLITDQAERNVLIQIERLLLGNIMLYHDAFGMIPAKLQPSDFLIKEHADIYSTMLLLLAEGRMVNIGNLSSRFREMQGTVLGSTYLEEVGGIAYLRSLKNIISVPSNIPIYADAILKKSIVDVVHPEVGYAINHAYLFGSDGINRPHAYDHGSDNITHSYEHEETTSQVNMRCKVREDMECIAQQVVKGLHRAANSSEPGVVGATDLDFGDAIRALKGGSRVARKGWNGKGMWLSLSGPEGGRMVRYSDFWSPNNSKYAKELEMLNGHAVVLPCITMKTADGSILMGWLASQTDMLADDWMIIG